MCQADTVSGPPVETKQQQQQEQEQQQPREESTSRRRRISSRMKRAIAAAQSAASSDEQQQQQQSNGHHHTNNSTVAMTNGDASGITSASAPARPGLGRLAVCAMGICICYLYYGILQERLFSGHEKRRLGASFVLVTQCLVNVFVAQFWQYVQDHVLLRKNSNNKTKNDPAATAPSNGHVATTTTTTAPVPAPVFGLHHSLLLLTSACYVAAMACSNEAIQYVSYPVAVLAKSCKLIPSMLVGQFVEGRLFSPREWLAASLISSGIVLFHSNRLFLQNKNHNKNVLYEHEDDSNSNHGHFYGLMLLLVSLAMDGLLSSCQNFLKRQPAAAAVSSCDDDKSSNIKNGCHRPPNAVETMLYINLYALIFLIPLSMVAGQWNEGIQRLLQSSSSSSSSSSSTTTTTVATDSSAQLVGRDLCWALFWLNGTVAIGQIFIFLTIHWYTPLVTTTITTTRKFFTILLSVLTFGHEFTTLQWMAVALVFSGLYLSILTNTTTTPPVTGRITTSDDSKLHKKTE